ncbi:MAG: hypothetical protein VCA36_13675, partial [Opitutales bacterium]
VCSSDLGCSACHDAPVKNASRVVAFASLPEKGAKGCLVDATNAPRFGFSVEDRLAITRFLQVGEESLHRTSPQEFAARQFKELRCIACHDRDGIPSKWDSFSAELSAWKPKELEATADKGNTEQAHLANRPPPSLTFAGEKLRTEWSASLLGGATKVKPRPWMHARMPAFPTRARLLAKGLAFACGLPPDDPRDPVVVELAEVVKGGAKMANLLCITCHGIGSRPPTAVFEGQGVNLLLSRQIIRKEHYMRWMLNPYRINPATIMPKFADEEGRSGLIDLLEGDALRQFDAVWHYLGNIQSE